VQDEGVGTREQALQQAEGDAVDLGVAGDVVEIGADEGEGLPAVALLDRVQPVDGPVIEQITAQPVGRVRGVGDDSAVPQDLGCSQDGPLRGRVGGALQDQDEPPPLVGAT
jgi:hypothetical protein